MNCLDFLSDSPKLFLFEKEVNKTNFGGVLMIIDIIIMSLIIIYYIIDYINTPNYEIQYKQYINPFKDDEIYNINENDTLRNPEIEMICDVHVLNFFLYDDKIKSFIDGKIMKRKVTDFNRFDILYKCKDKNCTLNPDKSDGFSTRIKYTCRYESFYIDDQSRDTPMKRRNDTINHEFSLNIYYGSISDEWNWHSVFYKEKKGFGKKENIYASGFIEGLTTIKRDDYPRIEGGNGTWYRYIGLIDFKNKHKIEDEYIRKAKSPLDFIANAISYFPNVYSILKFIFGFYSKNFNNYKTIQKIISKNKNNNITYSISNIINNIDNSKLDEFKINDSNTSNEKNSELLDKSNQISENENEFKLKKLRFTHFFLNNIYCNCCTKNEPQELINICNKILAKYLSFDLIAYNQILFENLLKDYKWNNPELNNLDNNNLIIELKNLIT